MTAVITAVKAGPVAIDKATTADRLRAVAGTPAPLYCLRHNTGAPYLHLELA
jgi:hypothetical protein